MTTIRIKKITSDVQDGKLVAVASISKDGTPEDIIFKIRTTHPDMLHKLLPVSPEFAVMSVFHEALYNNATIETDMPIDEVFINNIKLFAKRYASMPQETEKVWNYYMVANKQKLNKDVNIVCPLKPIPGASTKLRVGVFFSGGVDSLYTFMGNADITDAIHIENAYINKPNTTAVHSFLHELKPNMPLYIVETPLVETDAARWTQVTHGTYTYAAGLLFGKLLNSIYISGTDRTPGSDCVTGYDTDYLASSSDLRFISFGHCAKWKKVQFLSSLPKQTSEIVFNNMSTCPTAFRKQIGKRNCSKCLKCLLDMGYYDAFGLASYANKMFDYKNFEDKIKKITLHLEEPFFYALLPDLISQYKKIGNDKFAGIFQQKYDLFMQTIGAL